MTVNPDFKEPTPDWVHPLITQMKESTFLPSLNLSISGYGLRECCQEFYSGLCGVDFHKILVSCHSGSEEWKMHRKYRLTGEHIKSLIISVKIMKCIFQDPVVILYLLMHNLTGSQRV